MSHLFSPPCHIKLRQKKNYYNSIIRNGESSLENATQFPRLSNGKTKDATLIGPPIEQLMNEKDVDEVLQRTETVV
jgi:hypothetical protein